MIRVMIIDDELPALKMAESVLRTFEDIQITGVYSDPDELLESLQKTDADLLLVDMKMPGMHGLELAGRIQEQKQNPFIVFVTAYDDYAVDAFETDALDYIMKPITTERMKKTLDRFTRRRGEQKESAPSVKIRVQSFGRFCIEKDNGERMKFRTVKSEELMAFLLHCHGEAISKDRILDELWYDRDVERAQSMLYTTLYQLRKDLEVFGLTDIIQHSRKDGGICRLAWQPEVWDYAEYIENYRLYKAGIIAIEDLKASVESYKSGYLADHGYSWTEDKKSAVEANYIELLEDLADYEVQQQRYERAFFYLKKWAGLSPYSERAYIKTIALYLMINQWDTAEAFLHSTNQMLQNELGTELEVDMDALMENPRRIFFEQ